MNKLFVIVLPSAALKEMLWMMQINLNLNNEN